MHSPLPSQHGQVEIASVAQPTRSTNFQNHFIYQNSYESERFGTQLWKTVLWRGYEMVGQQRFVAQLLWPDRRHIAAAYVNNNLTLQRTRLPKQLCVVRRRDTARSCHSQTQLIR